MGRMQKRAGTGEPRVPARMLEEVRSISRPLRSAADLDPLLERIGDAKCVLLGEASHGTHEYYAWRDLITRRLIEEKGFSFIAVEGDWPDCYRVNRFVKGYEDSGDDARDVLHGFTRWPTWMWANEEIAELIAWLKARNAGRREEERVGFYGLDVYSLWDSLHQVIAHVGDHHPHAIEAARRAYKCFEPYGEDVHQYARATHWADASCESELINLLKSLRSDDEHDSRDGREAHFNAEQNALAARNAERYYRTMVRGDEASWNIRDRHMAETLERLMERHGPRAKCVVWEHNTHIGDARFTDMAGEGMVNLGQLVRESFGPRESVLVGFGSHRGSVIAGERWEAPMRRMTLPPARDGSWEAVLHSLDAQDRLLLFDGVGNGSPLMQVRGHRAVGVVYRPEFEAHGNYVPTTLPKRYDAFLYLDETRALQPLHDVEVDEKGGLPETFPSGV